MSRSNTGSFEYLDLKSLSVITLQYGSPLNAKVKLHKDTRAMSTTAKVTLGASITFAVGIITYVHYWQKKERERLREGVLRDLERQQRKAANIRELEEQAKLTSILQQQRDAAMEHT